MFNRIASLALFTLTLTNLNSHAIENRFARTLPDFSPKGWENIENDRISLWPICYRNGEMTSILWPIIDYDTQGYAVRPFFTKDKSEYSIFFPLSNWNNDKQKGWVGPYWWNNDEYGLFPVAGKFDDLSYIGPYWKTDSKSGIFPLYSIRGGENSFHFKSLAGIFSNWEKQVDGDFSYWQFPNIYASKNGDRTKSIFFPYYKTVTPYKKSQGVFPIYNKSEKGDDKTFKAGAGILNYTNYSPNHFTMWQFPNFYINKTKDSRDLAILPYFSSESKDRNSHGVFPIYHKKNSNEKSELTLGVGLITSYEKNLKNGNYHIWQFPNIYKKKDSSSEINVVFPYYSEEELHGPKHKGLFPLYHQSRSDYENKTWVFPAYYSENKTNSSKKMIFPYFQWQNQTTKGNGVFPFYATYKNSSGRMFFTLLGGGYKGEDSSWASVLGPIFYKQKSKDESYTTVAWPFYASETNKHVKTTRLWPLYHSQEGVWNESPLSYFSLYSNHEVRAKESNKIEKSEKKLLWGSLFSHKEDKENIRTTTLFGLLTESKSKKGSDDLKSFRVMKYLYRYEKRGENVYRDLFPGIKLDSSPKTSSTSLLWNMFSYKNKDGKKSGHFFFIPIGSDKKSL